MPSRRCRAALAAKSFFLLFVLFLIPSLVLAVGPTPRPVGPDGRAEYRVVELQKATPEQLAQLESLGFDIERYRPNAFLAYVTVQELAKLEELGIAWVERPDPGLEALQREALHPFAAASWHTYETLTDELKQVANDHPTITRLTSVGKTVQGREMWVLKITTNPDTPADKPGFAYLSTMHGDEVVGMEMCLRLIHYLTDNYPSNSRAKRLVENAEIWIMPNFNPDGTTLHQRYNADGIDLNRNFPDMFEDPNNTPNGRAKETQNMMGWVPDHFTVLGAMYHGGALVDNYPYDNTADGGSYFSPTPDEDVVKDMALDYAEDNGPMHNSTEFKDGITNGAAWYSISGGIQDWFYHWNGHIHFTIEVSDSKWPDASTIEGFWNDNRESMLSFLERVLTGVRGIVTDSDTGAPVAATLQVVGRDVNFYTDPVVGDFHRPLMAGNYQLQVSAPGYETQTVPFTVAGPRVDATRVNVSLKPASATLSYANHRLADDANNNQVLEAGEIGHVAVSLKNAGKPAAGVTGRLRSVDRFLTGTSSAAWPDIASGSTQESLSPHLAVTADPATPPGHRYCLAVDWTTADGIRGTTSAFFLPSSAPESRDYPATGLPKSIPDGSSYVLNSQQIDTDAEILDVNVRVDITHPNIGDLLVKLVDPSGQQYKLHNRTGGSADNIHTWYDTETAPSDSLAPLVGKSTKGTWKLVVADQVKGNTGTFDGWTLQLNSRPWETPAPEVTLNSLTQMAGKTRIEWWPVGTATSYKVYRANNAASAASFTDVTSEDTNPSDTLFEDATVVDPGQVRFYIISAVGHGGEGLWGHYGR